MITQTSSDTASTASSFSNDKKTVRITVPLWQISYRTLFAYAFFAPIIAYVIVMSIGYLFHRDVITNYKTDCGLKQLYILMPSFSRIIGVPVERTLFNLVILTHVPLRFIIAKMPLLLMINVLTAIHDIFFAGYGVCGVTYSIMTTFIAYHNPKIVSNLLNILYIKLKKLLFLLSITDEVIVNNRKKLSVEQVLR
uniref:Battenin n=1 Tax=Syphacia muris TaxID=451379 RepID=A0A0N5AXJ9_9BILA